LNSDDLPYLQNRATLHLHGGNTPWISDETPHQWTVPSVDWGTPKTAPIPPAGDNLNRGVSTRSVPDMWFDDTGGVVASCAGHLTCAVPGETNDPGTGNMTSYWTSQQGGRLMFCHDHAYGITRLNVYIGEAAGYLLTDPPEENRTRSGYRSRCGHHRPATGLGTSADLAGGAPAALPGYGPTTCTTMQIIVDAPPPEQCSCQPDAPHLRNRYA